MNNRVFSISARIWFKIWTERWV